MLNFIETTARHYRRAETERAYSIPAWEAYAREVLKQWRCIRAMGIKITLFDGADVYADASELRADIMTRGNIRVWSGGKFSANHPIAYLPGTDGFTCYQIARAVHDFQSHYRRGFSFKSIDELRAALMTRHDFSALAQAAQFADDIGTACHYVHFGSFPDVQYPVSIPPDYARLERYLDAL